MQTFALVMTAVFGCVVATGVRAIPGELTAEKVLAVGTATLVTLLVGLVLAAEIRPRR